MTLLEIPVRGEAAGIKNLLKVLSARTPEEQSKGRFNQERDQISSWRPWANETG